MNIFELVLHWAILTIICYVSVSIEKRYSVSSWIVIPLLIGIVVTVLSAIESHIKKSQ